MKKFNALLLLFVALFCSVALTSCLGDDEKDTEQSCLQELNKLAQLNYTTTKAFADNPTTANCNAMKKTATDFFNKAKQCGDADMIYAAEVNLEAVNDWNCNEL